jgi:DNA-binding response OmpR family regulator
MPDQRNKILIVDNDEEILIALERLFENQGYDTAITFDHAGLQSLPPGEVDLLVLDDYLSDADCLQVMRDFRGSLRPPTIVTYRHRPSLQMRTEFEILGVDAVVDKGAHPQLLATVRRLLSGNKADPFECMT